MAKRPRIPAECLDPAIKSLNYLNNILAKVEAIDAGPGKKARPFVPLGRPATGHDPPFVVG